MRFASHGQFDSYAATLNQAMVYVYKTIAYEYRLWCMYTKLWFMYAKLNRYVRMWSPNSVTKLSLPHLPKNMH